MYVEGCLKRICKDNDREDALRDVWKDGDGDFVLEAVGRRCGHEGPELLLAPAPRGS